MKIAAIDPGVTTGYAIAKLHEQLKTISLERIEFDETTQWDKVLHCILRHGCYGIVMEKRPQNASREGTENYEALLNGLLSTGYKRSHTFIFSSSGIVLVTPGHWKPVMKAQKIMDFGSWEALSDHMRDALAMLHYVVKLNFMSKEVQYE